MATSTSVRERSARVGGPRGARRLIAVIAAATLLFSPLSPAYATSASATPSAGVSATGSPTPTEPSASATTTPGAQADGAVVAPLAVAPLAATTGVCSPGDLYYTTSYDSNGYPGLMKYSGGTSTVVKEFTAARSGPPYAPDALGVSSGYAYFIDQQPQQGVAPTILRVDLSTGAQASFTGATLNAAPYNNGQGSAFAAGAVNPFTGIYYYGYAQGSGSAWDFYAFDTNTNTSIGFVGRITLTPSGSIAYQGDIAFDPTTGDMYFATFNSTVPLLKVAAATVPTTAQTAGAAMTATSAGTQVDGPWGLAYMSQETSRPLWSDQYGSALQKRTAGSNDSTTGPSVNSYIYDLASCAPASPVPTLTLKKNIVKRVASGDQFTLIAKSGTTTLATATTTGSATGVQSAVAGPATVSAGSTYTIQEAASGTTTLSNYNNSALCIDTSTNNTAVTVTPAGTGAWTVSLPSGTADKATIECTITNTPAGQLTLTKNIVGRAASTDQFTLTMADSSGKSLGSRTTSGSTTGAQANAQVSTTYTAGQTYTLQEAGAGTPAADLNRYVGTAQCKDATTGATVATTAGALGAWTVSVPSGYVNSIDCTITNRPPAKVTLTKNLPVGRAADTDQFTLAVNGGNGTPSGTATTTTTSGTATGTQAAKVGPVDAKAGTTVTLQETAAGSTDLGKYTRSMVCTDSSTKAAATVTTGTAGTWSLPIPADSTSTFDCVITNLPPATIAVSKSLSGGRVAASDQFTVQLRTGGSTGTVLDTPGNENTAGTGTTVDPGTGTTGKYLVDTGTAYTITEVADPGVDQTKYTATVTCSDAAKVQTGLPDRTALGTGLTITPQPGAQITCTLDNAGAGASVGLGQGLTCETGYVYALASTYPGKATTSYSRVYKINVATGAAVDYYNELPTSSGTDTFDGNVNALAISQGGLYSYYSTQRNATSEPASLPVFQQDNIAGTTKLLATMAIPTFLQPYVGTVRGGINPTDGIYWVSMTGGDNNNVHYFWAYNTLTGQNYGYVGSYSGTMGSNGDLVFDQDGNMLIVTSTGLSSSLVRVTGVNAALAASNPTDAQIDFTSKVAQATLATITTAGTYNGITFDNDGLLWVSYTDTRTGASMIRAFDPNTGDAVKGPFTVSGIGQPGSKSRTVVDLADCNDPGGLRLQKDYAGRVAANDNVKLTITRTDAPNSAIPGGTATTNGPATGLQDNAAAVAIGVPGHTYSMKESVVAGSTSLPNYSTTLACVDKTHGNASLTVTKVSQGEYTLAFPGVSTADGQLLANVVCTYTNTPNGTLQLSKQLGSDRATDADQFQVRILNSPARTVATSATGTSAVATTTGAGSTVSAGTTPVVRAQTSTDGSLPAFTFDELGWSGGVQTDAVLASYPNPTLTCTDAAGIQPIADLPAGMRLSDFLSITPAPGAQISCVITNTTAPLQFHVLKQGLNCDVGLQTCPLKGAQFALYVTDPSVDGAMAIADGITADEVDGAAFTSKDLMAGSYWLVETKAPRGHALLPTAIHLTLRDNGVSLMDGGSALVTLKNGDAFTIVVSDTTASPLPKAGGEGPLPNVLLALILLGGGAIAYLRTSGRRLAPRRARD